MTRLPITSAKLSVVFAEGKLPQIDVVDPGFTLVLGGVEIQGRLNPKACRKLAAHQGGAVLQGRLVAEGGRLNLLEAGFTWIEPRAQAGPPAAPQEGGGGV